MVRGIGMASFALTAMISLGLNTALPAADAPAPAATQPAASRPGDDIVLARLGDKTVITQSMFESYFRNGPPVSFDDKKDDLMRQLVEREWLRLYLGDYRDLVSEKDIDDQIERIKKRENLKTPEQVEAWLRRINLTPAAWRERWRLTLGRSAILKKGQVLARDEKKLREIFDARKVEFDGTEVTARHIQISTSPFDTPAEKAVRRQKAQTLRDELVGGRRAWDEAVKESDCTSRRVGGKLGTFTRHMVIMEPVSAAAFAVDVEKFSDVIESPLGFHIINVTRRTPGTRGFDDAKREMKIWLEREQYLKAIDEMRRKYPLVGVRQPLPPATQPAFRQPSAADVPADL